MELGFGTWELRPKIRVRSLLIHGTCGLRCFWFHRPWPELEVPVRRLILFDLNQARIRPYASYVVSLSHGFR